MIWHIASYSLGSSLGSCRILSINSITIITIICHLKQSALPRLGAFSSQLVGDVSLMGTLRGVGGLNTCHKDLIRPI